MTSRPAALNFRCFMVCGATCSASLLPRATTCASIFPSAANGIRISCGGSPNDLPTCFSLRKTCCGNRQQLRQNFISPLLLFDRRHAPLRREFLKLQDIVSRHHAVWRAGQLEHPRLLRNIRRAISVAEGCTGEALL